VTRPRCPHCHGDALKVYKTERIDDGGLERTTDIIQRYTSCRTCGKRFIVLAE
jgi:transcriptional regulator NrdR family protein